MFGDVPWSIVVKASCQQALPNVSWSPAQSAKELFGFRQFYYNPCKLAAFEEFGTRKIPEACLEIFGVVAESNDHIVCEVSPEHILTVAVLPLSPKQAFEIYQRDGLTHLLKQSVHVQTHVPYTASTAA